jgi:hypothetical protein
LLLCFGFTCFSIWLTYVCKINWTSKHNSFDTMQLLCNFQKVDCQCRMIFHLFIFSSTIKQVRIHFQIKENSDWEVVKSTKQANSGSVDYGHWHSSLGLYTLASGFNVINLSILFGFQAAVLISRISSNWTISSRLQ